MEWLRKNLEYSPGLPLGKERQRLRKCEEGSAGEEARRLPGLKTMLEGWEDGSVRKAPGEPQLGFNTHVKLVQFHRLAIQQQNERQKDSPGIHSTTLRRISDDMED